MKSESKITYLDKSELTWINMAQKGWVKGKEQLPGLMDQSK